MTDETRIIAQQTAFDLAGITRGEYRVWGDLLAPIVEKGNRQPKYSVPQTFAICVLAELMHALNCGTTHLVPISKDFFAELCSGDWRRFEHRRLIVEIAQAVDADDNRSFEFSFKTIQKNESVPDSESATVVLLNLAPLFQKISNRVNRTPAISPGQEAPSFEEHKRRRSEKDRGADGRQS
ncbi:MAG TPA: hypothetical protein VGO35_07335 [Gammaproteobacteria bacterium]|jgi:hypothetical protein|nr:hypothetical protein [Gammaproteobacteria bacterium]